VSAIKQYHTHFLQPKTSAPIPAFPQIPATSSGSTSVAQSQIVTAHPAGVAVGNRLLLFVARLNAMTMTWPAGWTSLITNTANDGTFEARWRDYQAGDTAPTVTGSASAYAYRMLRITGHDPGTAPAATTLAVGTSTSPNPGSLDPSDWGSEDTLWIAVQSNAGSSAPSGYPADYGNGTANQGTFGPALAFATRELAASSDDPGTFTLTSSQAWGAATIAIRPAPPAGAVQTGAFMLFI
jgi:hypothetical protein